MNPKQNKENRSEIRDIEPWDRVWNGFNSYHTLGNRIGGAFGFTRREMQEAAEKRNRKAKEIRKQALQRSGK